MRRILAFIVALGVLLALGITAASASPARPQLRTAAATAPSVPAGYKQIYTRNFAHTPGLGGWVVQPGAGAAVLDSTKPGAEFGVGVEMTATNQWAELILGNGSDFLFGPNAYLRALVFIPKASGASGTGKVFPAGSTANWPALWSTGRPWPQNGELDMLEGQTARSCMGTHYGVWTGTAASGNSKSGQCSQGYGTGTGWTTVTVLRTGGQVKVWYGGVLAGTAALPTTANEELAFQNQSFSDDKQAQSDCPQCFGPTLLGAASTAWLSNITVWSK